MKYHLQCDMGLCRICGTSMNQRSFGREKFLGTGQTLRRCGFCGGVYLAPDPTPSTVNEFYSSAYRKLYLGETIWLSENLFFRHRLDDEYAKKRCESLVPYLSKNGRFFELGSGYGAFLNQISQIRPDVELFAAEPDVTNRSKRQGSASVSFISRPFNSFIAYFDVIAAFHVFEHLSNPQESLHELVDLLKDNGRIVIEVPDVNSNWCSWNYVNPAHLSYFSTNSLTRLMQRVGLEIEYAGPHPGGDAFSGTLLAIGIKGGINRNDRKAVAANSEEIDALDRHISSYNWGVKDSIKKAAKNLAVSVGLGPMIGLRQRWTFYRKMKRAFK